ncbi:hypothetical protein [Methylobacterium sp. A54F]
MADDLDSAEHPLPGMPETARTGLLAWTLGIALPVILIACTATYHLARIAPNPFGPALLTAQGLADPETTGSIGDGARAVRLDPCALRTGLRP